MSIELRLPNYKKFELHQWADYFELVCLASRDDLLSFGEIGDRLKPKSEDVDFDKASAEDNGFMDEEEIAIPTKPIDKKSKNEAFVADIVDNFKYRIKAFGDAYPFTIEGKHLKVINKSDTMKRLYIYLLMCSSLSYFNAYQSDLTSDFELVSLNALKSILSDKFKVEIFGKNSKHPSPYKGKEYNRIKQLCDDLNEKLLLEEGQFANTSTGDGGIDIVAFLQWPDNLRGRIIFFAQCKCSPKWKEQILSSSYQSWTTTMTMMNPSTNVAMIPYCMRRPTGDWHAEKHISGVMLIDRQRLIDLLAPKTDDLMRLESCKHVNAFLAFKEDIV